MLLILLVRFLLTLNPNMPGSNPGVSITIVNIAVQLVLLPGDVVDSGDQVGGDLASNLLTTQVERYQGCGVTTCMAGHCQAGVCQDNCWLNIKSLQS